MTSLVTLQISADDIILIYNRLQKKFLTLTPIAAVAPQILISLTKGGVFWLTLIIRVHNVTRTSRRLLSRPQWLKRWIALSTWQFTIQWISSRNIHWKEIYPVDCAMHLLKNWDLDPVPEGSISANPARIKNLFQLCIYLPMWPYVLLRVAFSVIITVSRSKSTTIFPKLELHDLRKKTLLKIWFNPGLNIWTTARSEFLCRDSDYVSTSYDKRTVWMTPGAGTPRVWKGWGCSSKILN